MIGLQGTDRVVLDVGGRLMGVAGNLWRRMMVLAMMNAMFFETVHTAGAIPDTAPPRGG